MVRNFFQVLTMHLYSSSSFLKKQLLLVTLIPLYIVIYIIYFLIATFSSRLLNIVITILRRKSIPVCRMSLLNLSLLFIYVLVFHWYFKHLFLFFSALLPICIWPSLIYIMDFWCNVLFKRKQK